jgi:hypothetical protein
MRPTGYSHRLSRSLRVWRVDSLITQQSDSRDCAVHLVCPEIRCTARSCKVQREGRLDIARL